MIHITGHAIQRYQERVQNVPADQARIALSSPTIMLAARIGAPFVRLGTGQRIVIADHRVITVLPADRRPSRLHHHRRGHSENA